MDAGTGLTILGSAYGGAKLIEKLLGPTADYLGNGLRNWAEKRVQNVGRIFEKATEKLGDKIDESGSVPPRVLKEILDEGSYCDDELAAEYFGGVLASSRNGTSRDDRAASYLKKLRNSRSIKSDFIMFPTQHGERCSKVLAYVQPFGMTSERCGFFFPFLSLTLPWTSQTMNLPVRYPYALHCRTYSAGPD